MCSSHLHSHHSKMVKGSVNLMLISDWKELCLLLGLLGTGQGV